LTIGLLCPGGNGATLSSLSLHYIKRELSQKPGYFADFILKRENRYRGLLSGRTIDKFDILAVTTSWAGDYFKLLKLLKEEGIEIDRTKRKSPEIITGGSGIAVAHKPFLEVSDAVFIGDGDGIFLKIFDNLLSGKTDMPWLVFDKNTPKPSPRLTEAVKGVALFSSNEAIFKNTRLVEISRGCPYKCRFCWLSSYRKKYKFRAAEVILDEVSDLNERAGLVSAALLSHPEIINIFNKLDKISLPSCRLDLLDEEVLKIIASKSVKSLTLAPEVGSERMGTLIGKKFDMEKLEFIAVNSKENGIKSLKLYGMVGLPGENYEDVEAFGAITRRLGEISSLDIEISVNQFIPMPGTDFQDAPFADMKEIKYKMDIIRKAFKPDRKKFKMKTNYGRFYQKVFRLIRE